jgi:membrane protein
MNDTIRSLGNFLRNRWRNVIDFFHLLYQAAIEFSNDNALKFSASLSYYTLFSLAPMLIIVIAVSSIWFGKEAAEGFLYQQFEGLLGTTGALQLQEMISNAHVSGNTPLATIIGILTLVFGATGVFLEIQDSINAIWSLRAKPKRGWLISNLINVGVVVLLFAIIFKVLPDAILKWSDVGVGALFTTLLFLLGKWLINYYLSRSSTMSVYGAAGAVVLIVLWVYYSSAILYFGAEFTKVYVNKYGSKIRPNRYSVFVVKKEIQTNRQPDYKNKL